MNSLNWSIHSKTSEAWEAMLFACAEATSTIDLEQYIFAHDEIGVRFIETLLERKKAGVRIRLLLDTAGSYGFYNSPIPEELEKSGFEIKFFNRISPWRINNISSWFFRDHRKILIIDSKIGFIGGVGIRADMKDWRDTHLKVEGHITEEMVNEFNEMWDFAEDKDLLSRYRKSRHYSKGFNIIKNAPYIGKRFLYYSILDAIRSARKHIFLTTPYFVPDHRLLRALILAVKRKVSVQILLPQTADVPLVNLAAESYFHTLLKSGIEIFRYNKSMLHAKTITIDNEWSTVGSYNLDNLSALYNYEANIVSTDRSFAEALEKLFKEDLKDSNQVLLSEWNKRSFKSRIREIAIVPLRPIL